MIPSSELTPENFIHAVQTLCHDQDTTRKQIASEWLLNVQSSLYAWTLADKLIRMNQNSEVTCLAAQILRRKIQYNFDELPIEHCQALCDSLLDHLSRVELTRNSAVRVQLAVATADLALQYVGWEQPVETVVEKLKSSIEHTLTILEFLTALPEEINTTTIRIGENRRHYCREKYCSSGKQIHDILIFLLHANTLQNESLFIGILKCFASWISIQAFDENLIMSSPLLISVLSILKSAECSNELHKSACDCLCNILELCEDYQKFWSLTVHLKQEISQYLCQPYIQAVKEENLDKAQNYTRIYTNLIESIADCIIDGRQSDLSDLTCLNLLLYPAEHTDYEVVQSTFYTWSYLSELIQTNNTSLIENIKPYVEKLVDRLCVQCKLDPDHLGIPPQTDGRRSQNNTASNSDLAEFRYRVQCLIEDTIHISDASNCFQRMFNKLQSSTSLSWEESEAPLYIMSCVASYLPSDEEKIVPTVVQAIISTPIQAGVVHSALKYTGVRLISQLEHWISKHDQHILKSIFQYLLSLLVDVELRQVAADAILTITPSCRKQLLQNIDQIVAATLWLDQNDNSGEAVQCLLKASSKLISRLTSTEDIHRYLKLLFDQQIQSMSQILSTQSDTNHSSIIKRLDCLTAIFRSLDFKITREEMHPCTTIIQQLLPLLNGIIIQHLHSVKLSESWSRTIRFIIRSMQYHAKVFFQPIIELIIKSYADTPHSCFLYLISIIVDEYGNDPDIKPSIILMSEHLTNKTFTMLNKPNGFQQNPDLVDDFYRLSSRLLQRCPLDFLKSNIIGPIIEQIIPNCHLEHRDASSSMIAFLQSLVKLTSDNKKEIKNKFELSEIHSLSISFCERYFPDLLTALIRATVIYRVPSSIRLSISELIYDIKTYMHEKFPQWLKNSLTEIPRTSKNGLVEIVTAKQYEEFYTALCKDNCQPTTVDDEFEKFARLYR